MPLRPMPLAPLLLALSAAAQAQSLPEAPQPHNFFTRLDHYYREDWHPTAPAGPAPPRRGVPSPLDSPPFPSSDWSYGGSPTLGEPDSNSYPLMAAIHHPNTRTKVYGWIAPTVNGSTSARSNSPESNDAYSNRLELNQAVLYIERLPDTVQRDHIDIGFHLTGLYGTDYRYTMDKGYLSAQLLKDHHQYGFDPALEYIDIYLPHLGLSTDIRVGRFISIPGIEAQLTPNNYFLSHSLLYSIDPFTDTGVLVTTQLTDRWLVQAGLTASHDVALWTADAQPSGTACLSYTTKSVNNNFYLCANGINDGKYAYNNLQQYDATWYRKFGRTWHAATEAYFMYERDVPSATGSLPIQLNTNGAACRPNQLTCFAPEYAIVNYINKELSPHSALGFRCDFLNDKKGQRTGIATKYTENTLSFSHWIGTTIQFRPEIRLDHSWDRKGYDNGTRQTQFTAATDLIVHF